MGELTREQFLKRCETAYDAGLITDATIPLLYHWLDFVMRFEGGQMRYVVDFLEMENRRLEGMTPQKTLANDSDGYKLQQFAAILHHSCQSCAEDTKAWWTRPAFCEHKKA